MKQIRQSVFETNSSSTHSFSISNKGNYQSIKIEGPLYLYGGWFEWGWEKFNDWFTKSNYVAQHGIDKESTEIFIDLLKEYTGASEVILTPEGNIDHQSHGSFRSSWNKEDLKNFIFNDESFLFIGNDNERAFYNFFDSKDKKYTHKLKLVNINIEVFYDGLPSLDELEKGLVSLWNDYRNSLPDLDFPDCLDKERHEYELNYRINYGYDNKDSFAKIANNTLIVFCDDWKDVVYTKEYQFAIEKL